MNIPHVFASMLGGQVGQQAAAARRHQQTAQQRQQRWDKVRCGTGDLVAGGRAGRPTVTHPCRYWLAVSAGQCATAALDTRSVLWHATREGLSSKDIHQLDFARLAAGTMLHYALVGDR